jgi:type IV pilus assembly protein PilM
VRLGIANQRIVVRTLDLPPLADEKAPAAAVKVQAPDHIPMPMEEAVLDWHSLGEVETAAGPRNRVVVVAARREAVDRLVAAAGEAGLTLAGIDLSAFGMVRALQRPGATGATLYVSVAGLTNVAVANERGCLFTRAAAGGLDAIVHTLAGRRGLTLEHSRQWMGHVGLVTPIEDVEGEAELVGAARAALEEGVHQLADTVRNSLNFYRMQESSEHVENGIVTGSVVSIPGFVEALSEQLRLPLEAGVVGSTDPDADLGRLTVAAGLAVEEIA